MVLRPFVLVRSKRLVSPLIPCNLFTGNDFQGVEKEAEELIKRPFVPARSKRWSDDDFFLRLQRWRLRRRLLILIRR
ncbi:hypothetical protein RchiOBHm_Chr3g0490641 [Rosa chinensis]|uniref:Uncharacterized protein n=1 Tax=Rosa chinensis TaxID=74649 RepID=A0A2P6RG39_ROSCH|nr:hypothetical protein RchiOBHm_Chr3g0490641 [Rosa chinensis]